ncbi:BLUF domain-containing protein [Gramella sp. KN1008]|uniref:BLUF domain-containing protein n=1 Tax=Gramella sp. KN1008 TaxID=2529298 RepID=UPI00103A3F9D|nr:BLUF domain-containing protein [Gramella sp. KN1008]TBW29976.1 blue light sensor protein [Gramella sp. KN1008]
MKLPYTICYTSVANQLDDDEVNEIFEITARHNNNCKIQGLLLYSKDTNRFFQVLEGEKKEVIKLYHEKILKDPRHSEVTEIFHKPTSKPIFFKYTSKFNLIKSGEDLQEIKKYIEEHKYSKANSDEVLRLLEPFLILYS